MDTTFQEKAAIMVQFSRSRARHGRFKDIGEWQSWQQSIQPDVFEEVSEHSDVSRLYASLLSLFKEIILALPKQATVSKKDRISLERSCSALILWSDDHGIAQGCLDDKFKESSKLRHLLYKNLSNTGRVLTERLIPLAEISSDQLQQLGSSVMSSIENARGILNEHYSDDSSSDDGSTVSNDNLYEVAEDLKTNTYVMSCLDRLIEDPVFDIQQTDMIENNNCSSSNPESFFVDKIGNRFPRADASLTSCLGKANFERYLRCQANREAQDVEENEEGLPSAEREAPELSSTIITESKFHDSGVGTSIASRKSYAETLMSYSREGQCVRIPPLPKDAKDGSPFSCVACGRTVCINNNSSWKRHIYHDLQPYMCLYVSCSYSGETFESREKWVSHLAFHHDMEPNWRSIKCLLCKEETGNGKLAVIRHFSEHLEEISLSALPIEISSNASSEYSSELSDSVSVSKEPSEDVQKISVDQRAGENYKPVKSLNDDSRTEDKGKSISVANDVLTTGQQATVTHQYEEASKFFDMVKAHCANQPDKYIRCCHLFIVMKETGFLYESLEDNEAMSLLKIDTALRTQFDKCSLQALHAKEPIGIAVGLDPYRSQPEILESPPAERSRLAQREASQEVSKVRNFLENHAISRKDFNDESRIANKSHINTENRSKSSEETCNPKPDSTWPDIAWEDFIYEDLAYEDKPQGSDGEADLKLRPAWLEPRLPTLGPDLDGAPSSGTLLSDTVSSDRSERYHCPECKIPFNHQKDLQRHLETTKAHQVTAFQCCCTHSSGRKDNFLQHIIRKNPCSPVVPYMCSCGVQIESNRPDAITLLLEHIKPCGQRKRGRPRK